MFVRYSTIPEFICFGDCWDDGLTLGLDGGNDDGIDDVCDGSAAAQVIDWLVESLEQWPNGDGIGGTLDGFVTDITGIERRENKDIGFSCDGAVGKFRFCDRGDDGCIVLDRAFDGKIRVGFADFFGSFADGIDIGAASGCPGGV